jgi:hypothetical protein
MKSPQLKKTKSVMGEESKKIFKLTFFIMTSMSSYRIFGEIV